MEHEFPLTKIVRGKTSEVGPSNAMGPLVGKCKCCDGECCNCKTCAAAKSGVFNICANCRRDLISLYGENWAKEAHVNGISK